MDCADYLTSRNGSLERPLIAAHHPNTPEELLPISPARMRLAFDEMLANQLYLGLLRRAMRARAARSSPATGKLTNALLNRFPSS